MRKMVLCGLWTWKDLDAQDLKDVPTTDLIIHRVKLKEGCVPYAAKGGKRLSKYQEEWLKRRVTEGLECGMYERTPIDEPLSEWNAPAVLVCKDPNAEIPWRPEDFDKGPELRLTFNYSKVHEDLPAIDHPLASTIYDLLSDPTNHVLSKWDLKHGYHVVTTEIESRHILAFNVPGIGQLRPTRMPQGCRSSSATMAELGKIALGPIPPPNPQSSLIGEEFAIFVDDMFGRGENENDHFTFVFQKFFPRIEMANMRCTFRKMEIFVESLTALGQQFRVGGELYILPERVEKIMAWPSPTDKTGLRSFIGAIQICRRWVKNFTEIARPLSRLQGTKKQWRWGLVEETAFRILKNKCATDMAMHGVSWDNEVRCYFDASDYGGGFALTQVQNSIEVPIIFDSFAFNPVQRRYGTYKRELLAIVHFASKYKHYVTSCLPAIFFTDHKPLISFLNSDRHEGIYARWALKLREMNFEFVHIDGKRNVIADGLSRTIFPGDEPEVDENMAVRVREMDEEGNRIWFWKDGKGGYEEMIKKLIPNQRRSGVQIGDEEEFPIKFSVSRLSSFHNQVCSCYLSLIDGRTKFPSVRMLNKNDVILASCKKCGGQVEEGLGRRTWVAGDVVVMSGLTEVERRQKWEADEWYRDIYRYLADGGRTPRGMDTHQRSAFKLEADRFRLIDGNLYRLSIRGDEPTPCILEDDVLKVLEESHDECGHYASSQVIARLQGRAWWPGRNTDVKSYVDGCISCARYGPAMRSHSLQPTLTYRPFDLLGMDFIGPLPTSTNGYRHIFHVIDYFSRYTKAWACKHNNASEVVRCLKQFFEEYPVPVCIYSDRGTHFTSPETRNFLEAMQIAHVFSPSGSSKSTGMIERHNQELEKAIKKTMGEERITLWDQAVGRATRAINTRRIVALGFTPFQLLFGIHPRLPFEYLYPGEEISEMRAHFTGQGGTDLDSLHGQQWEEAILSRNAELEGMRNSMIEKWTEKNAKIKAEYDTKIKGTPRFRTGDLVMLYDNTVGPKGTGKLAVQWPGPYQVVGFGGEHRSSYRLKHIHGGSVPGVHHGDHLKIYRPRPQRLQQPFEDELHLGPRAIRALRRRAANRMTSICRGVRIEEEDSSSEGGNETEIEAAGEFWESVVNGVWGEDDTDMREG